MNNQIDNAQSNNTQFLLPFVSKRKHISDSAWKRFRKIARAYIKSDFNDKELEQLLNEFNLNLSKRDSTRLLANYRREISIQQETGLPQYPLVRHRHCKSKGPEYYNKIKPLLETLEKAKNPDETITEKALELTSQENLIEL